MTSPVERPEWLLDWTAKPAWASLTNPFLDGVVDDVESEIEDWSHNRFRLLGRDLRVEWVEGLEAHALRLEHPPMGHDA